MSSAELLAHAGQALIGWLGPITLATGAILAAALVADRLLERRATAAVRLWLYAAVLLRLALPAGWQSPLGVLGSRSPGLVIPGDVTVSLVTVTPLEPAPLSWGAVWAALAYAAVALALGARWLQARLALGRQLRQSAPLGEAAGFPVLRHPELGTLVTGLFRPRIVVPAALADAPDREPLHWVLRHERAHLRRRDLLVGALIQLVCLAAWPVLPVWIAARRIRALMEVACDEEAVEGAGGAERRRYGEVLLALAHKGPRPGLAPVFSFGWLLKGRLRALALRRRWPKRAQAVAVLVLGTAMVACAGEPPPPDDALAFEPDAQVDGTEAAGTPSSSTAIASPRRSSWRSLVAPEPISGSAPRSGPNGTPPAGVGPGGTARRPPVAAADGRFAPTINVDGYGAMWLGTRRLGSLRIGDSQPLEPALREALAETGSRTVLVQTWPDTPKEVVARVMEAARRAGATDQAVTVFAPRWFTPPAGARPVMRRWSSDPVVIVTRGGQLYLGSERLPADGLESALRRALERAPRNTVLVQLDDGASAGPEVADVMAAARRAGATEVTLLTKPLGPEAPGGSRDRAARGTLDPQLVSGTVREHIREVKACYEQQLAARPDLAGRLSVHFTIEADGSVEAVALARSTLGEPRVENCVMRALRGWQFPRPQGGRVTVDYPFIFAPSGAPASDLPHEVVRDALAPHRGAIRDCYSRHLQQSRADGGKLIFRWVIQPGGEISEVTWTGPELGELGPCVRDVLSQVRFPPLEGIKGPLTVAYPFYFQAGP